MTITIDLPPVAKGRPRFARGQAYTPQKTRDYEDIVRLYAKKAKICVMTGEVYVTIHFYLPIPKGWSNAKKQLARDGLLRPTTKPDLDNLGKAILDALNGGIAYNDDKQIVDLTLRKFYSDNPRTVIMLEEIT